MLVGTIIICCSLVYLGLISFFYFRKNRLKNLDNRIYKVLVSLSIIGLFIELGCCYFVFNMNLSKTSLLLNEIINHVFLIYLITWLMVFAIYIFFISVSWNEKKMNKIKNMRKRIISFIVVIFLIIGLLTLILPIYYHNTDGYVYSYGPATDMVTYLGAVTILLETFIVFKNRKKISIKKYSPLVLLIILMIIAYFLRQINPGWIVINSMLALITALMYFTIENPDMRMVDELLQNKKLVEDSFQERSTFLFKISQDVKEPVSNINKLIKLYKNEESIEEKKEILDIIENNSRYLTFMVNDVLNISSMDIQKLNIMEDSYKTLYFFEDIKRKIQTEENTLVEINYKINQIPNELMGDSIKLKQALIAIIKNAINNTAKGFVDIDINALVRYDVCRLIITIEDSSDGMSINKINDILSNNNEISEKDLGKLKDLDVGFEMAVRIIKILGGMVDIQSEDKKGTKVTIIINQRIPKQDNTLEEEVKSYNKASGNKKRILLVSDKQVFQKKIELLINKDEKEIVPIMFARECIDRLQRGEKYYLIIIDDSMKDKRSLEVLQELQSIPKFNTKVIVILDKMTIGIKEQYLSDGFTDYILKDNLKEEIERINSKYLS